MKLKMFWLVAAQVLALVCAQGQTGQSLDAKITAIVNRPAGGDIKGVFRVDDALAEIAAAAYDSQ